MVGTLRFATLRITSAPNPSAPAQTSQTQTRAPRCSRPASSRRCSRPPATHARGTTACGTSPAARSAPSLTLRWPLSSAICSVSARPRNNARSPRHRCDASASARRAPAGNRSRSIANARRRPRCIAKRLAIMPAFRMRLQFEPRDDVGGLLRQRHQDLFLRSRISPNTVGGARRPSCAASPPPTARRRAGRRWPSSPRRAATGSSACSRRAAASLPRRAPSARHCRARRSART